MRGTPSPWARVRRLEAEAGAGSAPLVVVFEGPDGVRRDPATGEPATPPPGAQVIVFTTRPDGPQ